MSSTNFAEGVNRAVAGQTLSEIRSLLAAAGLSPRHRFGQNFLHDLNLMRKVVATADVGPNDVVLEVGPGTGSLTEMLLETGARVIAVEVDHGLAALLRERLGSHERFTLIEGDALAGKHAINPAALSALQETEPAGGGSRKLVANLPYQIATPLIMELLYRQPPLASLTCTIQMEVAERLSASPRTAAYGPLSVILHLLATVRTVARIPAGAFWPRPKIESALVHVAPRPRAELGITDVADFVAFVQSTFTQRRKMLRRILRECPVGDLEAVLERLAISNAARPEELSPSDWVRLHAAIRSASR
ncbi:MAG: ribosomal RNA small subunit methyltransferase A [Phycisphaerae bacterium]|nr:ribosomal RNA small subunit methyltransferase A [Phycisphaerae bacterium]